MERRDIALGNQSQQGEFKMRFTSFAHTAANGATALRSVALLAALLILALALAFPAPIGAQNPEPTATVAPAAPADTSVPEPPESDVRVTGMTVSPDAPAPGDTVTVLATVTNFGDSEEQLTLELSANDVVVDSQSVTVPPKDARQAQLSFAPTAAGVVTLALGEFIQQITVAEEQPVAGPTRVPVGPTVRLRPNRTVITRTEDAIIDMFWDNSIINTQTYMLEVTVDVPIGLYLYSADGAMGCGAGTCKGLFEIPPGSVRTLPMIVKADEAGNKFIHMNGRYFPQDAPEMWNPIGLTVPITVEEPSITTEAPIPIVTDTGGGDNRGPPPPPPTPEPPCTGVCNICLNSPSPMSGGALELAIGGLLLGALWARTRRKRK